MDSCIHSFIHSIRKNQMPVIEASAPASVKMSGAVRDVTHFELDLQTSRKVLSLCCVCSEVGTGAWEGSLGYWSNG